MIYSRRAFCRQSLTTVATAALCGLSRNPVALAQTNLSPEGALQQLIDGNQRFAEGRMTSFAEDLDILKAKTLEKQEPFAAVLSCADSRVPVELIFDQSLGHVFVARVAGNIATSTIIASLEYGAAVLGTTAIMVLGHANCGAVKASIQAKAVPGQISALYRYIRPAVDQAGPDQGQRPDPGVAVAAILAGPRRGDQAEAAQNRRRILRVGDGQGFAAGLSGTAH
jgi:carbonic anhydrase